MFQQDQTTIKNQVLTWSRDLTRKLAWFLCCAGHDVTSPIMELTYAPITIGSNAWVAARAIVMPGRNVGEGAVVAAGAVVTNDVLPWTVVAGNPARIVKRRALVER